MQHLLNEDTDSVADRGVHPADQTLEQPITGKQRGCQRQTEEQRAERDPEEVKAHQAPCPHQQRMASLAFVACGDRFAGDVMVGAVTRTTWAARPPRCGAGPPATP